MDSLLVEWIDEEEKLYSVVKRTDLVDGEIRRRTKLKIGQVVDIQWGRNKEYRGKILEIGKEVDLEKSADLLALKEVERVESESPEKLTMQSTQRRARKKHVQSVQALQIQSVLDQVAAASANNETLAGSVDVEQPQAGCSRMELSQRGRKRNYEQSIQLHQNEESLSVPVADSASVNNDGHNNDASDIIEETPKDYKGKYRALRAKYRSLKEKYKELKESTETDTNVEIYPGTGVYIPKKNLDSMKVLSKQITVLARNLFRALFTTEELANHSLYGKKCNANRLQDPYPAIDSVRRDAIINFVLQEYNLEVPEVADPELMTRRKAALKEVRKSLSDFLREERRK